MVPRQITEEVEPARPVNEGDDRGATSLSDDQVALEVAHLAAGPGNLRPGRYRVEITERAGLFRVLALGEAALSAATPAVQVGVQARGEPPAPVGVDRLVDRLVAERGALRC